jgi:hypothetical protein
MDLRFRAMLTEGDTRMLFCRDASDRQTLSASLGSTERSTIPGTSVLGSSGDGGAPKVSVRTAVSDNECRTLATELRRTHPSTNFGK